MDTIIPGLILAAISALTFVAYKHPNSYRNMFTIFAVVYGFVVGGATAWNLGGHFTYRALKDYIVIDKLKDATAVVNSYQVPDWMIMAAVGLYFYLFFLTYLPKILDQDNPEKK